MAADESRVAKRWRCDFGNDITILVGPNEQRFVAHKDVLVRHSTFFRACCSESYKEGQEKTLRLPDSDPEIFPMYLQWAYSGALDVPPPEASPEEIISTSIRLIKLYMMADFLGDTLLRNKICDIFSQRQGFLAIACAPAQFRYIYQHTREGCKLRNVFVGVHQHYCPSSFLRKWAEELPRAFLTDLAVAQSETIENSRSSRPEGGKCEYHEHDEDVPKCH